MTNVVVVNDEEMTMIRALGFVRLEAALIGTPGSFSKRKPHLLSFMPESSKDRTMP
jgi:hypothetical protein